MGIVIREQDILKKEPPHAVGFWDENSIRSYQESYGINYGASVFVRGSSPYREWSNDRTFNGDDGVTQVNTDALRQQSSSEVDELKAQIQSLKDMIASMQIPQMALLSNVKRHGLAPTSMDKRTKEYKDSKKAA